MRVQAATGVPTERQLRSTIRAIKSTMQVRIDAARSKYRIATKALGRAKTQIEDLSRRLKESNEESQSRFERNTELLNSIRRAAASAKAEAEDLLAKLVRDIKGAEAQREKEFASKEEDNQGAIAQISLLQDEISRLKGENQTLRIEVAPLLGRATPIQLNLWISAIPQRVVKEGRDALNLIIRKVGEAFNKIHGAIVTLWARVES